VDLDTTLVELLLDLRLTEEERQQYRQRLVADWKNWDQNEKRRRAKNYESWAPLPTWGSYQRNEQRAFVLPKLLALVRKKDASASERWLAALYETASKPGGARNPLLVDGKPPLTQRLADRYIDYLEIMIDLSVSGGFTPAQRKVLQGYLVKDWRKMSADDRAELLGDLKTWSDAAEAGSAEANHSIRALRPKLLAQLRTTPDSPRSQWLLEVCSQERRLYQQRI